LLDGLLPELEVALDVSRVVRASVEALAASSARLDLDDVAAALRAIDADGHGLGIFAPRVAGARQKLAVATGLDDHGLAAIVAFVVGHADGHGRRALAVGPEVLRGLALRVGRAAE